jgi:outer membrane protein OmpA-like peptidoglycan-associated protein
MQIQHLRYAAVGVAAVVSIECGGKNVVEVPPSAPPGPSIITNAQIADELRARAYDATETIRGVVVRLPDVYLFEFGRSEIGPEGRAKLHELAAFLNRPELASRRLTIEGHADSIGNEESNQELSERRAEAVRQELVAGQIAPDRLTTMGFGESRPAAPNAQPDGTDNPAGRSQNRRAEILIENAP